MGEHTEHIRKIGRSVEQAKQLKTEIHSICGEIDDLLARSRELKKKKRKSRK